MNRSKLSVTGNTMDLILTMSERNPGGLSVLSQLMKDPVEGLGIILDLDDMNIRGTQIWIGYKDHCGQDLEVFKKAINDRDPKMIELINHHGLLDNHPHRAVNGGASFELPPQFTEEERAKAEAKMEGSRSKAKKSRANPGETNPHAAERDSLPTSEIPG